jgi:acyl carrier protein
MLTREIVLDKVIEIVASAAECSPKDVKPDTSLPNELDIDSLMGLEVVVMVERQLKVSLSDQEMNDMTTPNNITNLVMNVFANNNAYAMA